MWSSPEELTHRNHQKLSERSKQRKKQREQTSNSENETDSGVKSEEYDATDSSKKSARLWIVGDTGLHKTPFVYTHFGGSMHKFASFFIKFTRRAPFIRENLCLFTNQMRPYTIRFGACTPIQSFQFIPPPFSSPSVLLWCRYFESYTNQNSILADEKDCGFLAPQLYPFLNLT